uniref:Uncharacterized protein n=1 Tax=Anguilla anguilla TaxID=7936 RepID=A0A0E9T615_ANGAN
MSLLHHFILSDILCETFVIISVLILEL